MEATGEGCPKNITNFEECDFEKIVRENIKVTSAGFLLRGHCPPPLDFSYVLFTPLVKFSEIHVNPELVAEVHL